jgi:hypothetical protein
MTGQPRQILSTEFEILNDVEALIAKLQNKTDFGIWIWSFGLV